MAYKVYYNEEYRTPSHYPYHQGDFWRYKAGNTGKSHSVVRTNYVRRSVENEYGQFGVTMSSYYYNLKTDNYAFSQTQHLLQQNRVIAKFEGKLGPSGAVGSSIFAEGAESVRMAVTALDNAARLVRAFKRKDFSKIKKIWNKPMRPTTAMKKAGGKWLEFSFGWSPLVNTVCDAIAVTGGDFPPVKVKASDRMFNIIDGASRELIWHDYAEQFVKTGYTVTVDNPNTWLLGRLDLINPGGWIWEAIPYSFFVDYFVNINEMIHNLDAFAGLSFSNGYSTWYHKWDEFREPLKNLPNLKHVSRGYFLYRDVGLPLKRVFTLQENPLTSSWRRGLNASSFLAQRLR